MKLFDDDFDLVQGALSDGMSVKGKTADGYSVIQVTPTLSSKNKSFLSGWIVSLWANYEGGSIDGKVYDVYTLYKVKKTSMDSMFSVTSIFLSLAKHGTIEVK